MAQAEFARLAEVLEVLGIGQRIAALDIVHAQLIEPARQEQLVLERKVDAFALAAVAQGRVINANACHGHLQQKSPEAIFASGPGQFRDALAREPRRQSSVITATTDTMRTPCAAVMP